MGFHDDPEALNNCINTLDTKVCFITMTALSLIVRQRHPYFIPPVCHLIGSVFHSHKAPRPVTDCMRLLKLLPAKKTMTNYLSSLAKTQLVSNAASCVWDNFQMTKKITYQRDLAHSTFLFGISSCVISRSGDYEHLTYSNIYTVHVRPQQPPRDRYAPAPRSRYVYRDRGIHTAVAIAVAVQHNAVE